MIFEKKIKKKIVVDAKLEAMKPLTA